MDNEKNLFRHLSKALTGGNAQTWDEIIHAAEQRDPAMSPTYDQIWSENIELRRLLDQIIRSYDSRTSIPFVVVDNARAAIALVKGESNG